MIATQSSDAGRPLDQAAFVALVEPVLPAAYRLARGMLHSEADAEDAVQDAMARAWRHRDRFRAGAAMKPWLLAIVANECRHMLRSPWWSVVRHPVAGVYDRAPAHVESSAALRQALLQLPHDQRLVVVLRYYLDLPFDEVARVLNVTTKAAKSRTYRALERLRLNPEVIGDERD